MTSIIAVATNFHNYKVVFLGDDFVGKTSIITSYVHNKFITTYEPTIGIDFLCKTMYPKDRAVRLHICDFGGKSRYRSLIPSYICDSSATMIVYDVTNRQSFLNITTWKEEVFKLRNDGIIILVANKCDVVEKRQVSIEEGDCKARELGFMFIETSAKDRLNTKHLFEKIVITLSGMESSSPKNQEDKVDVNSQYSDGGFDTMSLSNMSNTQEVTDGEKGYRDMADKRCWSILERMMKEMLKKMEEMHESNRMVNEKVNECAKVYDKRHKDMLKRIEEVHDDNKRVEEKVKECRKVYDERCKDMLNKMDDMFKRMEHGKFNRIDVVEECGRLEDISKRLMEMQEFIFRRLQELKSYKED